MAKNDINQARAVVIAANGHDEWRRERDLAMYGAFIVAGYSLKVLPI